MAKPHKNKVTDNTAELPAGVVKVAPQGEINEQLYLAVKDKFVVVALKPEVADAVLKNKTTFEVLPEVRQA